MSEYSKYSSRIAKVKEEARRKKTRCHDRHIVGILGISHWNQAAAVKSAYRFDPMPLVISRENREPVFIPTVAFGMAAKLEHQNVKDIRPYDAGAIAARVGETLSDWGVTKGPVGIDTPTLHTDT